MMLSKLVQWLMVSVRQHTVLLRADCTGRSAAGRTSWDCANETRHDDMRGNGGVAPHIPEPLR